MNSYAQVVLTIISGILIAAVTSWISVRLAIRQFYSQRWWERKADAYSTIIEAMYHVKHNLYVLLDAEETGREIAKDQREEFAKKDRESYQEIYKAEGIGAFIVSKQAAKILTQLRRELDKYEGDVRSWYDYLQAHYSSIDKALSELRDEAKRDLGIDWTSTWTKMRSTAGRWLRNVLE